MQNTKEIIIVAWIYIFIILSGSILSEVYNLVKLNKQLSKDLHKAMELVIIIDEENKSYDTMLQSMNAYADDLEKEIDQYEYLHKLKKDLDRNTFK